MTKPEFLQALGGQLTQLPREEREKQLAYYNELLDDMVEDGMTDQEAVARLGDPGQIAREILQELPLGALVKSRVRPRRGWSALSIVLLVLGSPVWLPIALALLVVLLAVYIVIWAVIVVLFSAVLAIGASALALLFVGALNLGHSFPLGLLVLGGGIAGAGLSIFAFLGALAAAKGLVLLTARLARGVKSLFIKREA